MRHLTLAAVVLLGFCAMRSASAYTITVGDDSLSDWGVTVDYTKANRDNGDWTATNAGIVSWAEDNATSGSSGYVGPGYGGQNFDVEAAYLTSSSTMLGAAFVTGFDRAGQYGGWGGESIPPLYYTGDLFFDVNSNETWDFAVAMWTRANFTAGYAYAPSLSAPPGWLLPPTISAYVDTSEPWALNGALEQSSFTEYSNVLYAYSEGNVHEGVANEFDGPSGDSLLWGPFDHNIVEVGIPLSFIGPADSVTMHYTMQCGNDWLEMSYSFDDDPVDDIVPIPEPGTFLLLLQAAAVGVYARRRRFKGQGSSGKQAA